MKREIQSKGLFYLLLFCFIFTFSSVWGQFEQKITINASATMSYPDMLEEYSSFGNGYGIDGGLQFNISRRISFYGSARFYYMFAASDYEDAYYDNVAFAGGLKLNILPTKKLNPYIFAEANINFIWLEEYLYGADTYDSDFGTSIGGLGGLGLDFKLNDNLALFVQSGPYYTFWDNRINLYSQLGVRINLLKSKTI
jgi:hypothetical protein